MCKPDYTAPEREETAYPDEVFERFTERARRVVVLAQEEARMLNHNYIGTEHLLLGLIHEEAGVAARALVSLDISLDAVRGTVEEIVGQGHAESAGHIPFTPQAKKVLELSLREALQLGHNYIGTEHILLGLMREGEGGVAAQALHALGADLNRVRETVIEMLEGYTATGLGAETFQEPKQRWTFRPRPRSRRSGGDEPHCPTCQAPLKSSTGLKRVTATGDDEEREVTIAYCRSCGRALGTAP